MSIQAQNWVIEHSQHTGTEYMVLLMIANHANREGDESWPNLNTLARECRVSRSTVIRAVSALEASGELLVQHNPGFNKKNSYSLPGVKGVNLTPFIKLQKVSGEARDIVEKVSNPATKGVKSEDQKVSRQASVKGVIPTPEPRSNPLNPLKEPPSNISNTSKISVSIQEDVNATGSMGSTGEVNSFLPKPNRLPPGFNPTSAGVYPAAPHMPDVVITDRTLTRSTYIEEIAKDYSMEFRDTGHLSENVNRALRMWANSGLQEDDFGAYMIAARKRVWRRHSGGPHAAGVKSKMAYFFTTLHTMVEERQSLEADA